MRLTRRTILEVGGPLAATVSAGCTSLDRCTHFAVLEFPAGTTGGSAAVNLDEDALSHRQQQILAEAIEEKYGTCVDGGEEGAFAELIRRIFRVEGEIKHASSQERVVQYWNEQYLASFYVAVE